MAYMHYLYLATLLIVSLEVVMGRHKGVYDRQTILVTIGCIVGSAASRPLAAALVAFLMAGLLPSFKGALAKSDGILAFVAVFTIAEFCFYWVHRWAHSCMAGPHTWLWKLHRTHHSGKFMNVGLTLRLNAFWAFVVPTMWVIGIATYLGLEQAAAATLVTIYAWNLITHSHFRWDDPIRSNRFSGPVFRALEHVLVSPGIHHTHHGYGKDGAIYRNFAVTLSLMDWVFGTLHIPSGRPSRYGLPGSNAHWAEEVLYPLVQLKN